MMSTEKHIGLMVGGPTSGQLMKSNVSMIRVPLQGVYRWVGETIGYWQWDDLEDTETTRKLKKRILKLEAALHPFALYAGPKENRNHFPDEMAIMPGSSLARYQLTMGDCRKARDTLADE